MTKEIQYRVTSRFIPNGDNVVNLSIIPNPPPRNEYISPVVSPGEWELINTTFGSYDGCRALFFSWKRVLTYEHEASSEED